MNQRFEKSQKLEKWLRWMETIHDEILALVQDAKWMAHWDKRKPTVVPTFEELDDCIKLLDQVYVKYHFLFHAESMDTLIPTYQYEWKSIFCEPWLKVGFGSAKGLIHVSEDFDDKLPEFKEYME